VNKNPCLKINLLPEVLKYRLIKKLVAMKESKAGMLMEPHGILLPLQSFQKKKEKTEKKEKRKPFITKPDEKNKGSDQNFSPKVRSKNSGQVHCFFHLRAL
jgi:hypothetical protein